MLDMRTRHLPRASGVYRICNLENSKVYVGSAVDLQKRLHGHRSDLRDGKHANAKLQRAWNKYGATAFRADVLELASKRVDLVVREQIWIDTLDSVRRGYNICLQAASRLGMKWSPESCAKARYSHLTKYAGFVAPDGTPMSVIDAVGFSQEYGIPQSAISALALGKITSYRGWTHVNAKAKDRDWIKTHEGFIDPEGNPVPLITNMMEFCRGRGLDASVMSKLACGKKRMHHGWTHRNSKPIAKRPGSKGKEIHGFVDPGGTPIIIQNLARFCRDHGLDERTMLRVRNCEPGYLQHKGWKFRAASAPAFT